MVTLKKWEKELASIVLELLKDGRPNWDLPHTKAVVHWARVLSKSAKINEKNERIVLAAAYLHDIGYSKTGVTANIESLYRVKVNHMSIGAEIANEVLKIIGFESNERRIIVGLVKYHDELERPRTRLMQILIEADTLAQLDRKRVKPNFSYEEYYRWITDIFPKERGNIFKTDKGKVLFNNMYKEAKEYRF